MKPSNLPFPLFHCTSIDRWLNFFQPHRITNMLRFPTNTTAPVLALLIACTACPFLRGQDATATKPQSVQPGINASFLDPELDVDAFINRFEVESREIYSARDAVLKALDLKPGMSIADVGAGTGFYAIAMANAVGPTGQVFAVELAPKFVVHIRDLSRNLGRENVTPILCDEDSVRLAPNSVDVAFSSDVYHHFEYPQLTLASVFRALRPGGRWIVIDFERIEGVSREWTMQHVRAGKDVVTKEVLQAGFELVGEKKIEGFKENYFLEFRKPESPAN
jgi:ubiquinone/menaquinone biosynthesis C-methylase UbiE